ncbi:MAG TPA: ectonucleotide pyrophosphatase/phosphodiesterase [Bryobacteraceae bacterium]
MPLLKTKGFRGANASKCESQASALRDPNIPLPVLRKLIAEGAVADAIKPINPTVTWPNHTALITGVDATVHGVIYNGLPVRPGEGKPLRVEPWVPKSELVQARTVYDAAHEAGLTTAEVDWVAIYHAASINWSFAEVPHAEGELEREMLAAGVMTQDEIQSFPKAPITQKDEIWTRAAVHIIEKHKPNLLLMHLLTTDSVQHAYGAKSLAASTAFILADRQVQRILDAIDRAGLRSQTTVLVVSDHGFKTYQNAIRPNVLLREKGLLRDQGGAIDCDAWVMAEGGTAMVYVTRESKREATLKTLQDAFANVTGIAKVIFPAEYPEYGYPRVTSQGRMADMVLAAAPGYAFEAPSQGAVVAAVPAGATPGNHGYLNSDPDMNAILVASGAGIRTGARVGILPNVDVAGIVARLLNVSFQPAQGTARPCPFCR